MMKDTKIYANGLHFHMIDYGGEGEETIICIHGLTANGRCWDAIAEKLVKHYRVMAIDLRGRGDSSKPASGYHVNEHVKDIHAIIQQLNLEKVILVGHSLGAMIGVVFSSMYPETLSSLILIDGGEDLREEVVDLLHPSINRVERSYENFYSYITQVSEIPFFSPWNNYLEQYFYSDVVHYDDGTVISKTKKNIIQEELDNLMQPIINTCHSSITVPTLILWAPNCLFHPTAYLISRETGTKLSEMIDDSKFIEIRGANHFSILFHEFEQTSSEIIHFLKEVQSKKSIATKM
ncbi:alpha/beta fold hydrolase [Alkalihalobacterium elongatum]|uniref:alpha/beta fold hydrolase n=1 Tax=Alkalihalobacterium elongatum TaxID=2675466 RepID=UPI001C1F9875|nr:alpha/beta hydrolase [Alkalihalobacterium elongatum]